LAKPDRPRSEEEELAELVEVQCVNKIRHIDPRQRVNAIGGVRKGVTWKLTHADAIASLERGEVSLYVEVEGHSVAIVVGVSKEGRKYLRAITDADHPTTLLGLPECPRSGRRLQADYDWADTKAPRSDKKSRQ
jgi:hypothetical protein